jgi:hypothetical protein
MMLGNIDHQALAAERIDYVKKMYPSPAIQDALITVLQALGDAAAQSRAAGQAKEEQLLHDVSEEAMDVLEDSETY